MMFLKSEEEVLLIKESAQVLGKTHAEVAKWIKPGVTTKQLDKIADEYIRDNKGIPSFKGYNGFPASLCISLNETVVHGFPSQYVLKEGDIISIDCGVKLHGFHSDSAYTYPVGTVSTEAMNLLKRTKQSLYLGIEQAVEGKSVGDIGFAIQSYVERFGYGVVRELVGHGVGRNLHESPEVPNYGKKGQGPKLKEGIVIAIEPMITLGKRTVVQEKDGWTIRTADRKPAAHFEHTVLVRKGKAEILTTFKYIEEVTENTTLMVSV
ncbi:type I methionyl aminopeptidase [Runella sp. MFBS21]|uniref:type I methionyl aminopeptidase n=1 Tax=Runella sp. MFBS21 TaxID=3034018 RepID=UPI0023F9C854|nr:type I methionyl aminopeptidase [Runella sp. MFBS21]MDF7821968.1 type I methionyl aminopeptidase [Runella sp. MFBS21]